MNIGRRSFFRDISSMVVVGVAGERFADTAPVRLPKPIGSPVLASLAPVIENAQDVHAHVDKIVEVAGWMAYEELPMPEYPVPSGVKSARPNDVVDLLLVANCIDTAFTDFSTHVKFQVDYEGHWSDSDAMFACLNRAINNGIPVLDGAFLAKVSRPDLDKIFAGNI